MKNSSLKKNQHSNSNRYTTKAGATNGTRGSAGHLLVCVSFPGTHIPPDVQTGFVQPELLSNKSSNIRSRSVSEEERLKHKKAKRYPSLSDSVFENLDYPPSHFREE